MTQHIFLSEVEGKTAVCFDTGLDPRSFARTKMSQSLIESGYVVHQDGSHETWRAAGVTETNGKMSVWGHLFPGERLDFLLDKGGNTALQAIVFWLRAKMLFGETATTLNPGAIYIDSKGNVFFSPANLSNRCLYVEGKDIDTYNCPDLFGMEAVAFCAGVMLYKIFSKEHPYPKKTSIFQDMREGVFLPPGLAAYGLNEKLCALIQQALLLPVEKKRTGKKGLDIVGDLLSLLTEKENQPLPAYSLFYELPKEEKLQLDKRKKSFLIKQNVIVKTKRFAINNKHALWITLACVFFGFFIFLSTAKSIRQRPTTEGMASDQVVHAYYDALSSLNHTFMEACINGADRTDISVAAQFFAITKTRQAYEGINTSSLIPARLWRDSGGELPAPNVFGVTDIKLEHIVGSEDSSMIIFRSDYFLWAPNEQARRRSDVVTLRRDKRKNWRITEILRTEF